MNQDRSESVKTKEMRAIDVFHQDLALEESIQEILQNRHLSQRKKEKQLQRLQKGLTNVHLKSHVDYYLKIFQSRRRTLLLDLVTMAIIAAFLAYALWRLLSYLQII